MKAVGNAYLGVVNRGHASLACDIDNHTHLASEVLWSGEMRNSTCTNLQWQFLVVNVGAVEFEDALNRLDVVVDHAKLGASVGEGSKPTLGM